MGTIQFDGEDLDGHYQPLTDEALTDAAGNIKSEFYTNRDALKVTHVSALTVKVAAGVATLQNATNVLIPETQLILPDGSTRIVYVDSTGALLTSGSAPATGVLLARVVTSGGAVSTIADLRERVAFQVKPLTVEAVAGFVMPAGAVVEYAGSAPSGWLLCDGSDVLKSQYPSLFAAIGTAHGTPADTTKFRLPDHRDRVRRGVGGTTTLGLKNGVDSVTLSTSQMPAHAHTLNDPGHAHSVSDAGHTHGVAEAGHVHGINDAGHAHVTSLTMGGTDAGTTRSQIPVARGTRPIRGFLPLMELESVSQRQQQM